MIGRARVRRTAQGRGLRPCVARLVQARFEEAVTALVEKVHREHPADAVVLSGGAAMDSVRNGTGIPETPSSGPQTVTRDAHPLSHRLIGASGAGTGGLMDLNTSFNGNKPIVHRPQEAVGCFLRADMDVLVLGHTVVRKAKARRRAGPLQEEAAEAEAG